MRWRTKTTQVPPREGDQRVVVRFAWWPTSTKYGETVWLERYQALQRWQRGRIHEGMAYEPQGWVDIERTVLTPYY
jgi:hypothetical protein